MGEDKIIDFESGRMTLLFWNMDDYPIPVGTSDDLGSVSRNMVEALHQMGFRGYMRMKVYSEKPNSYDKEEGWKAQIIYEPKCKSYSAAVYESPDIALNIIHMTSNMGPGPLNVALIAKPNTELRRVLHCMKSRNHDVLVIEPPPSCCPVFSVESLVNCARLLDGGKPRFKAMLRDYMYADDIDEECLDIKEDVYKKVDFCERIPTVKGDRTAVFWDAEDYPFPRGSTPDEIYHSISSALAKRGCDQITISAYLDGEEKGSWRDVLLADKKTWASRIYFLPVEGDNSSRRNRMLHDIYLWVRDSSPMAHRRSPDASLVIFSDQFYDDDAYYTDMLQRLSKRGYDLLLITPPQDFNQPESPLWPGLLMDKGSYRFYV